ncbi:MAG TPA: signal peptidase I [Candidatus Limnocylindria bacterium]|nr:signal peptidase I [Candidatus Limnocylindria bacterium]
MDDNVGPNKLTWRSPQVRFKVLFTALLLAFVCYGLFTWVLWPVKVSGESMMPNYVNGSRHFINKLAYWSEKPQRGDVIGLRAPDGDVLIKRIIGMPGEHLSFDGGVVAINGLRLDEPYARSRIAWSNAPVALGPNDYYVMGDNRAISVLGPISSDRIIGKVVF